MTVSTVKVSWKKSVLLCAGLDARAAAIVMRSVKNVSRNGRTVMVTIHQPSIEIFEGFDALFLLQRGGRVSALFYMPCVRTASPLHVSLLELPGWSPSPLPRLDFITVSPYTSCGLSVGRIFQLLTGLSVTMLCSLFMVPLARFLCPCAARYDMT